MMSFLYMNRDIDIVGIKNQAISQILAINSYDSDCNDHDSFQRGTQAVVSAYLNLHNAFVDDDKDAIRFESSGSTWKIWKDYFINGFLNRMHKSGFKHLTAVDAYEHVDWPETVNWSNFLAPKCILKVAARAYGDSEAVSFLQMMKLHKEIEEARANNNLDATDSK